MVVRTLSTVGFASIWCRILPAESYPGVHCLEQRLEHIGCGDRAIVSGELVELAVDAVVVVLGAQAVDRASEVGAVEQALEEDGIELVELDADDVDAGQATRPRE